MNTRSRFLEKRDFAVVLVSTVLTYLVSLAAECDAAFTGESVRELGMLVDGWFSEQLSSAARGKVDKSSKIKPKQ